MLAATAEVLGAAAVVGSAVGRPGIAGDVRRLGARTQTIDQRLGLVRLGLSEAQRLDQALLVVDLLLHLAHLELAELVVDRAIELGEAGIHRIGHGTGVGRHVIAHLGDGRAVLAAAILQLSLESVGGLHVVDALLGDGILDAEAGLHDVGVDTVDQHSVVVAERAQALVDAVETHLGGLVVETALQISASSRSAASAALAIAGTEATAAPAAEQGEQDDQHPPAVAVAEAVVVAVTGHSRDIRQRRSTTEHICPP